MNKRIFRGISLTALAVLLLSMVVIFGALYGYFDNLQASRLRTETALAAQGVRLSGRAPMRTVPSSTPRRAARSLQMFSSSLSALLTGG